MHCVYVYIYIYRERERKRQRERDHSRNIYTYCSEKLWKMIINDSGPYRAIYIYIYTYIHIYIYAHLHICVTHRYTWIHMCIYIYIHIFFFLSWASWLGFNFRGPCYHQTPFVVSLWMSSTLFELVCLGGRVRTDIAGEQDMIGEFQAREFQAGVHVPVFWISFPSWDSSLLFWLSVYALSATLFLYIGG